MEPIEILQKVDEFYNSAWTKLLIIVGIMGILFPIIFAIIQHWFLGIREGAIKKELQSIFDVKLNEIKEKLISSIEEKFEEKSKEIIKLVKKETDLIDAGIYHVQANDSFEKGEYSDALESYIVAGEKYLNGTDYLNLGRVNDGIKDTLKSIKKEDLEAIIEEESEPKKYISLLKKKNNPDDKNPTLTTES